MNQEQLWAPWRLAYIKDAVKEGAGTEPRPECFLCHYLEQQSDRDAGNLVVRRGPHSVTVLNRYPYNNGHLLIAPRQHVSGLEQMDDATHLEIMHEIQRMIALLSDRLNADGFNCGLNLGQIAGAGLPGHLHWHVVPRWSGDTNFMPVLANIKVIPQSLAALHEILTEPA